MKNIDFGVGSIIQICNSKYTGSLLVTQILRPKHVQRRGEISLGFSSEGGEMQVFGCRLDKTKLNKKDIITRLQSPPTLRWHQLTKTEILSGTKILCVLHDSLFTITETSISFKTGPCSAVIDGKDIRFYEEPQPPCDCCCCKGTCH